MPPTTLACRACSTNLHNSHGSSGCKSTHLTRSDLDVSLRLMLRRSGISAWADDSFASREATNAPHYQQPQAQPVRDKDISQSAPPPRGTLGAAAGLRAERVGEEER